MERGGERQKWREMERGRDGERWRRREVERDGERWREVERYGERWQEVESHRNEQFQWHRRPWERWAAGLRLMGECGLHYA